MAIRRTRRWSISNISLTRGHGLFAEDFDRDNEEPAPIAIVEPVPVVDSETHKTELAHAWEKGRQAGFAGAQAEQRARAVAALSRLDATIRDMRATWLAEAQATAEALARLLCTAVASAFPALCARHGAGEVRAVLAEILPELTEEAEIRLRVAPEHAAIMSDFLAGMDIQVHLIADPEMGDADLHLEWHKGEAQRDAAMLWARISEILAPVTSTTEHAAKDIAHVD